MPRDPTKPQAHPPEEPQSLPGHTPPRVREVLRPLDLIGILGKSERTVRDAIRRHGIPHIRLGGRVLVLRDSLLAWLASREHQEPTREERQADAEQAIRAITRAAAR